MNLREELCKSIDKVVDREQHLGAVDIAVGIEGDFLSTYIKNLEFMVDNAHSALNAVLASGVCPPDVEDMVNRGMDNKPQSSETRMG